MSHHDYEKDQHGGTELHTVEGKITDIFAHRFVIDSADGRKTLADLGKHNHGKVSLAVGHTVVATGEMKPSELKIHSIVLNGQPVKLEAKGDPKNKHDPKKDHERDRGPAQKEKLSRIVRIAEDHGLTVIGQQIRPEHAEILGMTQTNELVEMHIGFDGAIRQSKPVAPDDQKWARELAAA